MSDQQVELLTSLRKLRHEYQNFYKLLTNFEKSLKKSTENLKRISQNTGLNNIEFCLLLYTYFYPHSFFSKFSFAYLMAVSVKFIVQSIFSHLS